MQMYDLIETEESYRFGGGVSRNIMVNKLG